MADVKKMWVKEALFANALIVFKQQAFANNCVICTLTSYKLL